EPSVVPENTTVTNITDQSFTLSWTTKDTVTTGSVYVLENSEFIPIISRVTAKKFYDTRDDLQVNWYGDYNRQRLFTHYVDITGLTPETKYSFRIQTGNFLYDVSDKLGSSTTTTLKTPETNTVPSPIYGRIMRADEINPQMGALVYLSGINSSGIFSSQISTVTNTNGSYTLDLTSLKDDQSNIFSVDDKTVLSFTIDSGNRGKKVYLKKNIDTDPIEDIVIQNETKDKDPNVSLGDKINENLNPIATNLGKLIIGTNADAVTANISRTFDDISSYPEIRILNYIFFPIILIVLLIYIISIWKNLWKTFTRNTLKINRLVSVVVILVLLIQFTFPIVTYASSSNSNTSASQTQSVLSQIFSYLQNSLGSKLVEKVNAQYSCGPLRGYCGNGGTCTPGGCVGETPIVVAPECTSGSRCSGKTVQNCSSGKWVNGEFCDGTTRKCDGGHCVDTNPAPAPATSTASPATAAPSTYSCGVAGSRCGRGGTCTQNGCVGETPLPDCSAGQTKCNGKTVQNCQNGKWNDFQFCDGTSQRCAGGSCTGTNTCATEDVNMGCEITNGIYTGKYKVSHKKADCSASVETITDNSKCPVSTTGYAKVCEATTKMGDCVLGANMRKKYDVKPDCSVIEKSEYDPSCTNTSYSPTPKDQKDAQAGAKKVVASIAKVSKTELDTSKDLYSSNPSSTGNCSLSDLGKQYDNGGACYQCIHTGNAERISDKACASLTASGSYACGSDVTIGIGYRFSKGGKCFQCFTPNSGASEVSCSTQIGAKVPESKLAGNVNCSDLDSAGLTGSLANQKCVTGLDREGNLTFRTLTLSDKDGDGYTSDVDCSDNDPSVHPGAVDTPTEDKNCDGKISYVFKKLNTGCSSSSQCESGLVCALKTSSGGNDEYICQKSIQTAIKDDIQAALENETGNWDQLINGYTSGKFNNYSKACSNAKNPQDCNENGIPDAIEQAYGINTSANGIEIEKIMKDAVKLDCESKIKAGTYTGNQAICEMNTFDKAGISALGSFSGTRSYNGIASTDLFTSNYISLQSEIASVFKKHENEGDPFQCTSGGILGPGPKAYCKTILQELNSDCGKNEVSKSGSLSDIGSGKGKLCLKDSLTFVTTGLGNYIKILNSDTKEQAAYSNYCTGYKKQIGIDCNYATSKELENSSIGGINNKYLAGGALNIFAIQLAFQNNTQLKDNCENQKARGFLASSFDCSTVKQDQKYFESSSNFSQYLTAFSSSISVVGEDLAISNIKAQANTYGLDPNKLEAFLRAKSAEVKELSYKLLFKDYMDKQGQSSANTDYALSMYSYANCITSPTKTDIFSAFTSTGFADSVNPNCKTEPIKIAKVGENGPVLSGVKRCAPSTTYGLDLSSYGKVCSTNSDCGESSCMPIDNGIENYYIARNGTKLPNGEIIDISQELILKNNLDITSEDLSFLNSITVLGSVLDSADILSFLKHGIDLIGIGMNQVQDIGFSALTTEVKQINRNSITNKGTSAVLIELSSVVGNKGVTSELTKEEIEETLKSLTPEVLMLKGYAKDINEANAISKALQDFDVAKIETLFPKLKKEILYSKQNVLSSANDIKIQNDDKLFYTSKLSNKYLTGITLEQLKTLEKLNNPVNSLNIKTIKDNFNQIDNMLLDYLENGTKIVENSGLGKVSINFDQAELAGLKEEIIKRQANLPDILTVAYGDKVKEETITKALKEGVSQEAIGNMYK
ncbi:MAG: fibronectin type III domain-containing protein, partial [bacterium]